MRWHSPEGVDRHVGVIGVGDRRADLGVGRVLLEVAKVCAVEVGIVELGTRYISDRLI